MDEWLDRQGLYRKNTALDGSCLFRAVAEQLFRFHCPNGHEVLRDQCVKFMKENKQMFYDRMAIGITFEDYLINLADPKQWGGQLELEALSLIHKVDFLLFKSVELEPIPATDNGYAKKLMLCFTPDNFYDAVYPKSYIENSGYCQSMVYGLLYRGVFKLDDLEYAVEKMLHDKSARAQREKYLNSQTQSREDTCFDLYVEDTDGPVNMKEMLDMGAILFPYKVAKALDPDIYRNIEFDNWVDALRVPRKNSFWFGNGGPLRVGVKCLLKMDGKCYNAHVQEMCPEGGPTLVFVEELGEKMTVPYTCLEPLPRTSLKPEWTFSHKHQIINKLNLPREATAATKANKSVPKPGGNCKGKKNRGNLTPIKFGGYERNVTAPSEHSLGSEYERMRYGEHSGVVIAEPDSTVGSPLCSPVPYLPQPGAFYGPPVPIMSPGVLSPCAWPPGKFKPVNVAVTKSVLSDCSDLPLQDLETVRFFFNLGIDYFRLGKVVYPCPPPTSPVVVQAVSEEPKPSDTSATSKEETFQKPKSSKYSNKPPRFLKQEYAESKDKPGPIQPVSRQTEDSVYEDALSPMLAPTSPQNSAPIPLAMAAPMCPYTPTYPPVMSCVPPEPPRTIYHSYAEVPMGVPVQEQIVYPHYYEGSYETTYALPYPYYPQHHYYYQN